MKYVPVQWNPNKWYYDAALLTGVALFLWIFIYVSPETLSFERPINTAIRNGRAFGAAAFVMLSVILCIGPLARLSPRFLPLLYNRRHFGVMTFFVALTHVNYLLNWYFVGTPYNRLETLLFSNTSYGRLAGFPFEAFGIFTLICLAILAATSHDFWLKFLTPPIWKSLHYLIYPAYFALVAHVALGAYQTPQGRAMFYVFGTGAVLVAGLHLTAALRDRLAGDPRGAGAEWIHVCATSELTEGRARIARLPGGDRVAVFLLNDRLSALSNACAHQNGPLGEGRVVDCLVTCPWHGFQYDVTNGRSPAPFTEKVPTYDLRVENGTVLVNRHAHPPGTFVEPVPLHPGQIA